MDWVTRRAGKDSRRKSSDGWDRLSFTLDPGSSQLPHLGLHRSTQVWCRQPSLMLSPAPADPFHDEDLRELHQAALEWDTVSGYMQLSGIGGPLAARQGSRRGTRRGTWR